MSSIPVQSSYPEPTQPSTVPVEQEVSVMDPYESVREENVNYGRRWTDKEEQSWL